MSSDTLFWKIYAGLAGAVTTLVAQKAVSLLWRTVTGDDEPPVSEDLEVSTGKALSWMVASGIGVAASQLLVSRAIRRQQLNRSVSH
ncbi:DUF4235 domain-containing protein [Acidipropionibacterium jensenii]|uniref:DUF4235 domain-containing protein n=1 Tax=Acidipropionibacterium jensenii TaxID=1749 RepID=A0A3T0S6R2_9ACTN|nr:DUF4235 domain-containing protein [Acidipropionibacterium jensenii]AZZ39545.1 DUF4235 domain-containing protein [Acidipropionibacterium jensenii]AZZ42035.1 DUF4235 domain-containing protein [Acidipropionibacterium jensenii]MDN5976183.1 DUF4235 domain-containing protein [Acidipropionibacterium jensenii]MDN5995309.1 DUF4235 domain-containing protein [Acidipropionibacterium jensenii]MDN6426888.1 DUF4235 domain-containing protein [Acidipropionibacterium jensenii]